jgi:hypothetical protein
VPCAEGFARTRLRVQLSAFGKLVCLIALAKIRWDAVNGRDESEKRMDLSSATI